MVDDAIRFFAITLMANNLQVSYSRTVSHHRSNLVFSVLVYFPPAALAVVEVAMVKENERLCFVVSIEP